MADIPVSYVGAGTAPAATAVATAYPMAYPTGLQQDDLLVAVIAVKQVGAVAPTATDWTTVATSSISASGVAPAAGVGEQRAYVLMRTVPAGGLTGSVTFTVTSADSTSGRMVAYRYNATGYSGVAWDLAPTSTSYVHASSTVWGGTGAANINLGVNHHVLTGIWVADDTARSAGTVSVTNAGTTLGTQVDVGHLTTTTGGDSALSVLSHPVNSGTASAAPVATMTGAAAETGGGIFTRIRATGTPVIGATLTGTGTITASGSLPFTEGRIAFAFDEGSGTTSNNWGTGPNDATGVPGWTTGKSGSGFASSRSSAGTGAAYVEPTAQGTSFTMMGWFRVRSTGTWAALWGSSASAWWVEVEGLVMNVHNGADISGPAMSSNTWTHVAVTSGPGGTSLYVDGTFENSNANQISLGAATYYIGGHPSEPGNMDVDDFRVIIGTVMDQTQIANLMNTPVASAPPSGDFTGSATRSGTGTITASGSVDKTASATRSGTGTITAVGTEGAVASASVSGTGAITTSGSVVANVSASATVSGVGAITTAGARGFGANASVSGTGSITTSGSVVAGASATLTGTGTITPSGTVATSSGATRAGTGTITTSGASGASASATAAGTGSITASGTVARAAGASLAGTGTLTAAGATVAAGQGSATLSGTGAIVTSGVVARAGSATPTGTGSITATGVVARSAGASVTGSGAITAAGTLGFSRSASVAGTGSITTSGSMAAARGATITGTGTITAAGSTVAAGSASATLTGTGTFTVSGTVGRFASATRTGTGALTTAGTVSKSAGVNLQGTGSITTSTRFGASESAYLIGVGVITAVAYTGEVGKPAINPQVYTPGNDATVGVAARKGGARTRTYAGTVQVHTGSGTVHVED